MLGCELLLERGPLSRILFVANLFFERIDLNRHVRQGRLEGLVMDDVEIGDGVADVFVADDLNLGPEDGVGVRVVPMKMRVDHPTDGLVRDQFHIFQERSPGGRRCPGVHEKHVAIADDDCVIAARGHQAAGSGVVHALGDLFKRVHLARDNSPAGPRSASALPPRLHFQRKHSEERETQNHRNHAHSYFHELPPGDSN